MPISSRTSYDRYGKKYDVTRILTEDSTLDVDKYKEYSPLFLSTTFALSYGLSFASITATVVHALLYFRKQIWTQARRSLSEQPDIHARLMSRYREVPEWWYAIVFVTMFVFGKCNPGQLMYAVAEHGLQVLSPLRSTTPSSPSGRSSLRFSSPSSMSSPSA